MAILGIKLAGKPSSGDHLFTCGAVYRPPHHFPLH